MPHELGIDEHDCQGQRYHEVGKGFVTVEGAASALMIGWRRTMKMGLTVEVRGSPARLKSRTDYSWLRSE